MTATQITLFKTNSTPRSRYYRPRHQVTCCSCKEVKPRKSFGPSRRPNGKRRIDHLCLECRAKVTARDEAKGKCQGCGEPMAQPTNKKYWTCPSCLRLRRRPERLREKLRRWVSPVSDRAWSALEKRNATDAWHYWLNHRAPATWLAARARALKPEPWQDPALSVAERYRLRYRHDSEFRLKELMRNYRRKATRGRYGEYLRLALKNGHAKSSLTEIFGYTITELRRHLERQFTKRMTWAKFNAGLIHIDHRRPLSKFDLDDPEQAKQAWALANLQPMWAKENLDKGASAHLLL